MGEAEVPGLLPTWEARGGCQGSASECGMKQDNNFVGRPEGSLKEAGGPVDVLGVHGGRMRSSQTRSARGKQLLRPQWLCAPAWLRVGAGSTFGARGFEGQPLGEGPRARLRVGLGVRQREFPQTDASFLCGIICEGL